MQVEEKRIEVPPSVHLTGDKETAEDIRRKVGESLVWYQTMIDWQVQVDGKYPPKWDHHRDGCWFPDFAYQEYLLPFFDVGGAVIDPYDGGVYQGEDLKRLRKRL